MALAGSPWGETVDGGETSHSPLRRLEAEFLRPYRRAIGLGLLGLLTQSVLLLPVPLLQGWVLDKLVAAARRGGGCQSKEMPFSGRSVWRSWATIVLHLVRSGCRGGRPP